MQKNPTLPQIPVTVDYPNPSTRLHSTQQGLEGSIMELTYVDPVYMALVILSDRSMPTISTDFLKYRPNPQPTPTPKETTDEATPNSEPA